MTDIALRRAMAPERKAGPTVRGKTESDKGGRRERMAKGRGMRRSERVTRRDERTGRQGGKAGQQEVRDEADAWYTQCTTLAALKRAF